MRKVAISSLLFSLLVFSSCLKEKYKIEVDDNTSRVLTEFTEGGRDKLNSLAVDFGTDFIEVDLAELRILPRSDAKANNEVKVVLDPIIITEYNGANSTSFTVPPAAAYSLPTTSFTLSPSEKKTTVKIRIKPSAIAGGNYALGLSISQVTDGEISKLKKDYLVAVKVKNIYEGDYQSDGLRTSYGGPTVGAGITGTFPWSFVKTLATVDATTCELETADGVDLMYLKVNANNTVTISNSQNGNFATSNDGACTYNPATKTFTLNYKYFNGVGNLRRMTETLVLD
jgi:Domain of unknown function (DUF1735)/Domain of unknown function (DUF4361)